MRKIMQWILLRYQFDWMYVQTFNEITKNEKENEKQLFIYSIRSQSVYSTNWIWTANSDEQVLSSVHKKYPVVMNS